MLRSREEWADGEGGQVGTAARVRASVGHAPSSFQAIRAAPGLCAYQHVQPALCSLGQRIQGKKTGVARQVPRVCEQRVSSTCSILLGEGLEPPKKQWTDE